MRKFEASVSETIDPTNYRTVRVLLTTGPYFSMPPQIISYYGTVLFA